MKRNAPPRVPGAMLIPNFEKLRVDTSEGSSVFSALKRGGCNRDADDLAILLDLGNRLTQALQFYVSEVVFAMNPVQFRKELADLRKSLQFLLERYPVRGSVLDRAISERVQRIEKRKEDSDTYIADEMGDSFATYPSLFVSRVRRGLHLLEDTLRLIANDESGRGQDGDRAQRLLFNSLMGTFQEFTDSRPGMSGSAWDDYLTPAESFAHAVIKHLPIEFQISDAAIKHRVREWGESNRP